MRILHTLEVRGASGEFLPKIGFSELETLQRWMITQLPDAIVKQVDEWRIVQYVPSTPKTDPLLVH